MIHSRDFNRRFSPKRHKTRVPTFVEIDGTKHHVVVRNVSFDGMSLFLPFEMDHGTPLSVLVKDQKIPAIVHWCKGGCVGIHLLERMDSDILRWLETQAKKS